ncbi:DUF1801 domain-containing protein [Octadecabacter sp. G9-8]|uniref:DUF1801 domain-containing protein n=1 Tax=Octadecabacter dasysiphoniae TaxID=2909341 RepID=A0ABS9CWS4_9RHOB|nr:DUF1801 domain-containing protein [Octadecabacter dasysiphoniae]MCF2870854.1 DUF1801 domain-containing protein [Octadecabacter dasysiphoniae]
MQHPFQTPAIKAAFAAFAPPHRAALLTLRDLIFDTAAPLPIGQITESLKWGQPSYTTNTATPIRLGVTKTNDIAILTHCQSTVMSDFRALAPPDMRFDGNRALHLDPTDTIPLNDITPLIRAALTYRL